jgi:hypothetical protein
MATAETMELKSGLISINRLLMDCLDEEGEQEGRSRSKQLEAILRERYRDKIAALESSKASPTPRRKTA